MKERNVRDLADCCYLRTLCVLSVKKIGIALLLSVVIPFSVTHAEDKKKNYTHAAQKTTVETLELSRDTVKPSYVLQQIDGVELAKVKDASFVNSLTGRLAGVTINSVASGMGGANKVLWRGYRSFMGTNNVLYALDGVPMLRLESDQLSDIYSGAGQTGDGISFLSADDIENVYMLSAAAASVLYGSQSANGVMMIDTKKAHPGKFSVNVGNSTTFSSPFVMPEFQQTYKPMWGDKLRNKSSWNPVDFFRTGHCINNNLSVSYGNEYNQTRFSAAMMNNAGIIPNNDVDRYNLSLRNTSSLLNHKLKLDVNLKYAHTTEQNMLSQGMYSNPLLPVYLVPDILLRHDETSYPGGTFLPGYTYKDYFERYDPELGANAQYWPDGDRGLGMQNPYWVINRNMFNRKKSRLLAGISAAYKIASWLDVSFSAHYDHDSETGTQKFYASTIPQLAGRLGSYYENKAGIGQLYSNLMFNVRKSVGDFSINAHLGTSFRNATFDYTDAGGNLRSLNNFGLSDLEDELSFLWKREYIDRNTATFLLAQFGYKQWFSLDLGGRCEWLDFRMDDTSLFSGKCFYPSMGVSVVPTEWMPGNRGAFFSYLKLGYAYSENGNSSELRLPLGRRDRMDDERLKNNIWDNERTKTHEVGLNMSFFNNKVDVDAKIYKSSTLGLSLGMPHTVVSAGSTIYLVADDNSIENKGIELSLGTNMYLGPVKWNGRFVYSLNKNEIKKLNGLTYQGEDTNLSPEELTTFWNKCCSVKVKEGGSIGDVYVSDFERDAQGNAIVRDGTYIRQSENAVYAGNVNPKYTMGLVNNFAWKGLELGFVINARFGGIGVSLTQETMDAYGVSENVAAAREQGGVWVNGELMEARNYYTSRVGTMYVYDATNIRLAEMSIAYHIPFNRWVKWIQDVRVALVGRNLLMLYNKAPFDPESTASTGTWYQGIDFFRQPSYRNMGFSVNLTF